MQNHRGLFAGAEVGYRKTRRRGLEWQAFLSAHYLYTSLANPVWVYQPDGTLTEAKRAGRSSLMYGGGVALGQNLYKTGRAPLAWSLRLLLQQPGQATSVLAPSFSAGISYYLTHPSATQ
ncbi:MAG: hypothetical protein OHK0039_18820 [Bacteroidia bacterium]